MSYYTDFRLTVPQGQIGLATLRAALLEITPEKDKFQELEEGDTEIASFGEIEWYDHHFDCAELSRRFPNVILRLEGRGQERGDDWFAYYLNGKCQISRGEMVFPAFDMQKFVPVEEAEAMDGNGGYYLYIRPTE